MARHLVGIDDTDFGESIGTGALAREAALHLQRVCGAAPRGITRHQLFVHPDIPYTSHNSAACLEVECAADRRELGALVSGFVGSLLHEGADPGVCVCDAGVPAAAVVDFGRRARDTVLRKDEALALCAREGLFCRELGGSGLGVIGAVAACGLRLSGDDGRFISLPGTRELSGVLTAGEIAARAGIDRVVDEAGAVVAAGERIDTGGWVRPDLVGGRVVLRVRRDPSGTGYAVIRDKHLDKH